MKKKILFYLQSLVLLAGTIFAYFTIYTDFKRYYSLNCTTTNPVLTPCFYGAFAFLIGFIWSIIILKRNKAEQLKHEKNLSYLLIAGTIFAWGNFAYELIKFYSVKTIVKTSCSGVPTANPFTTACFYGATIFLAALITSLVIRKKKKL
ncbi:MAG: hypothetical protein NTZ93_00725 [Candidatus Beckwithbacteria bacterium]|nr:hypothetical protein [Candidatus Beckwithbacteria bacterium]